MIRSLRILFAIALPGAILASCVGSPASIQTPSPPASSSVAATASPVPDRLTIERANQNLLAGARALGRTEVAICLYVDPSVGLLRDQPNAALQASVDALVRQGYTSLASRPVAACPQAPLYLRTNSVHPKNSGGGPVAAVPTVTTPSPFLLFVALTTPARIATIFGGSTNRRGSEEALCPGSGNNCAEVTGSIYMDPTSFAQTADREKAILQGLGVLVVP